MSFLFTNHFPWHVVGISVLLFQLINLTGVNAQPQIPSPTFRVPSDIGIEQIERPGRTRPALPDYQPGEEAPALTLPPVPPPQEQDRLSSGVQVYVRQFNLVGNTVFSDQDLAEITAPYENRVITSEELQELRHRLTLHYIHNGYINSGVIIPDQQVTDGVIRLQIIEGKLTDIEVSGNTWLRSSYVDKRLALGAKSPMNINNLQKRLLLLNQDRLIERINATLGPGIVPGEAILRVQMEEARPYGMAMSFNNHRSPSIGAERGEIWASHRNLTGWGDALGIRYGITSGQTDPFDDVSAFYAVPLNAYDTTLDLHVIRSDADVVEAPFNDLEITSETETYGLTLSQPLYFTPYHQLSLSLTFDRRNSQTFLLGQPFSFSEGVQDGESDVTVLRFVQDWLNRSQKQVIAARSQFSLGFDALGATINEFGPDGRFFVWLGQFQWARRLDFWDSQLIFRSDLQLSADPLLPLEKFAVGGANSVRGYRENLLVRDNGWVTSLEYRVPLFRLPLPWLTKHPGEGTVQLAPFVDFGWSWNTGGPSLQPDTITSVGLGLRWDPTQKIHAEFYWGAALRDIDDPGDDLQDQGIHFRLSMQLL